mgnify:CR=1 FL=1
MAAVKQASKVNRGAPAMRRLVLAHLREEGLAAAQAGRSDQAEAYLQRALALDGDDPDLWVVLGSIGEDDLRQVCARRALELSPGYPPAQALLRPTPAPLLPASVVRPSAPRMRLTPRPAFPRPQLAARVAAARPWQSPLFPARVLALVVLVVLVVTSLSLGRAYARHFEDRFFPGVRIAGLDVGGLSPAEAQQMIEQQVSPALARTLLLQDGRQTWSFTAAALGLRYPIEEACEQALSLGRTGSGWHAWWEQVRLVVTGREVSLPAEVQEERLQEALAQVAALIDQTVVPPTAAWSEAGWEIRPGRDGRHLDREEAAHRLRAALLSGDRASGGSVAVAVLTDTAALSGPDRSRLLGQMEQAGRSLELRCEEQVWTLGAAEIATWLQVQPASAGEPASLQVDPVAVWAYLSGLAPAVGRPVQQPRIEVSEGRAVVFQVGQDGRALDLGQAVARLREAVQGRLAGVEVSLVELPIVVVPAQSDALMAGLGLIQLIGEGSTSFLGSPENRVNNVMVGGQELHGRLIAPAEIFSLNEALDPVSWEKGYRVAPIISGGYLVMGLGGGLCQVSTTLYRAALHSGLEIVDRQPHQWRIDYYEQDSPPGFDATVMQGGPDFKFRNSTGHYLLIQVETDLVNYRQTIRFYGTAPGWTVTIDNLWISGDGLTVSYQRTVSKGGEVLLQETFVSSYQPHP